MSIFLYQKDNYKEYSTGDYNSSHNSCHPYQRYKTQQNCLKMADDPNELFDSKSSRFDFAKMDKSRKVFNMEDSSQKRIKRQYSYLYKKSTQQTSLFQKGVKKINLTNLIQKQPPKSFRKDHNRKSSELGKSQSQPRSSGLKRVDLKNKQIQQNAAGCLSSRTNTSKRKQFQNINHNKEVSQQNSQTFLFRGGKQDNIIWLNKSIHLTFKKSKNINSTQTNIQNKFIQNSKKHFFNKSNLEISEGGIIKKSINAKKQKQTIDFNQNYYKKINRNPYGQKSNTYNLYKKMY